MEICETSEVYNIEHDSEQEQLEHIDSTRKYQNLNNKNQEVSEKHCAIWTKTATSILLKLYENKLRMLETPKKKRRIWMAISESLQYHNIMMTPDQVRWKINALTKKYKQCVDNGQHEKFKYFHVMNRIYAKYPQHHVDCVSLHLTDVRIHGKKRFNEGSEGDTYSCQESRAMIEMRKNRLANRIDCDISQGKILLERQWLEYLKRQEDQKQWRDEIHERHLKLREDDLELRKRELELVEIFEKKKIDLMEKEFNDIIQVEREKCELLKGLFKK